MKLVRDKNPNLFFSKKEKALIIQAIQSAELKTSGEIRVHLERRARDSFNEHAREIFEKIGRIPVAIEILDDMSEFDLPTGSRAQVAVYSDHWTHVAIMRRILLRMSSWQNYLFLDH